MIQDFANTIGLTLQDFNEKWCSDFPTMLYADNDNAIKIPEEVVTESGLEGVWIADEDV